MRPPARHIVAAALIALALALPAGGQEPTAPATLIADQIRFERASQVIRAEGSVEILHQGARLRAAALIYDGARDQLQITGPIVLTDASGRTMIFADYAELSGDLREGVLRSARLVLDRQLQIAANAIERSEGRYTQLQSAVASSCEICADNPVPLWEIRAARVIHDQQERQIYFDNASFRLMGVPLVWLPRLRMPDPTLERATGFLTPSLRANDATGTHLQIPYFTTLGAHADLTLTPWIGIGASETVELRYRHAFRAGSIQIDGALSRDDLIDEDFRGYLAVLGRFDLVRDYKLDLALNGVTDRGYLTTYGFRDTDLQENTLRISRADRDSYAALGAAGYASLREGDNNDTLPTRLLAAEVTRRFTPAILGGIATVGVDALSYYRMSDRNGPLGRDIARLSGFVDWRRDTVFPGGLLMAFDGALYGDVYATQQDSAFDSTQTRLAPFLGLELRYPLVRHDTAGVTHLIEPVLHITWSDVAGDAVPIEDSTVVEFDEANLFALDRFPGQDQRETGLRANLGLGYTRTAPLGWSLGVMGGVVLRKADMGQFTPGSGLDGVRSDYLLATHFSAAERWRVVNRALFSSGLDFTSNELSLGWRQSTHLIETTYTWLVADPADPAKGRPLDIGEWALAAEYEIGTGWQARANWRYDTVAATPTRAGLALGYANECIDVEFSAERRYTASATLEPATEFGLTVALNGFGAQRSGRSHTRSCLR